MSLPLIVGLLVSSTVAGQIISATGKWKVYLIAGAVVMTGGPRPALAPSTPTPTSVC